MKINPGHLLREAKDLILTGDVVITQQSRIKGGLWGQIDFDEIKILKRLDKDDKVETLVHELLHYVLPEVDEDQIEALASFLFEYMPLEDRGFFEFVLGYAN